MNPVKKFSIPYNPKVLVQGPLRDKFFSFLSRNKDYITDIYFGYQLFPFETDARGGHLLNLNNQILGDIIKIKKDLGIEGSATFNGQASDVREESYQRFLAGLGELKEKGIRVITLNNALWVKRVKKDLPSLLIKNSAVIPLGFPQEIYQNYHYNEYDVLLIREDLLKDKRGMSKLLKVRDQMNRKMGIIMNHECCIHFCPIKDLHYKDGNLKEKSLDEEFYIQNCIGHKEDSEQNKASHYQRLYVFPVRDHYQWFYDNFDYLKMVGRTEVLELEETMEIVDTFCQTESKALDIKWFNHFIRDIKNPARADRFLAKHLTCSGECVFCSFCEDEIKEGKK